jgi:putative ABC transport system ATP-binding protein
MIRAPVIQLKGLRKVYPGPPPVEVLSDVDLTVRRGDFVSIMGASGSGKTTLLNLLGLLDHPTGGTYNLEGRDVSGLSERERTRRRARTIGFVFQDFYLLDHRTALENVMVALLYRGVPRSKRRGLALEALDSVHVAHRSEATPTRLSGGERQRVAIARALVTTPALLLCDEPTGNLDSENSESVLTLLRGLHEAGMTLLMITHDLHVARAAERIITIRDGHIVDDAA